MLMAFIFVICNISKPGPRPNQQDWWSLRALLAAKQSIAPAIGRSPRRQV
jgi:hypothetical protein